MPDPRRWDEQWSVDLGGTRATLAVERRSRSEPLRSLLAHLEIGHDPAAPRIEVREAGEGAALVLAADRPAVAAADPGLVLGAVYQALLGLLRPGADWLCLIHGGAVARHGKGIGLPARSGGGKTTLVAGLAAQGFDYLADDLLAIAAPAGEIVPWPMPLSVKPGSFEALAPLYPGLADAPAYRTKGVDARLLRPAPEAWRREPVPLAALVAPNYVPEAATELRPLRTIDMLARLVADRIWLGHPLEAARVERFVAWLGSIPCHELRYSRLAEAPRALAELAAN